MELLPRDQIAFQHMLDTIRRNFERFGFLPVETPVMELTEVLLTKSGGETERQVYFVQSTGAIEQGNAPEMALRFDLTVPLARYVAEHEHDLSFPVPALPDAARVPRRTRAARALPRVLPVRHRRDRQGRAQRAFRRRAAGRDLRGVQRTGDWRFHHPAK
jgi:histidyl-tRNA synthetase